MLANRRRDTRPELAVRSRLHALGYRYRVDFRALDRQRLRVDIAFTRAKVAVLIDGCFWHSCPDHATFPKSNSTYWHPKLRRNAERDIENSRLLAEAGWLVLRFWEHESPESVVDTIAGVLEAKKGGRSSVGNGTRSMDVVQSTERADRAGPTSSRS